MCVGFQFDRILTHTIMGRIMGLILFQYIGLHRFTYSLAVQCSKTVNSETEQGHTLGQFQEIKLQQPSKQNKTNRNKKQT